MIFGSMPRGALAGKDCFHARLPGLAMFGEARSAAVSKVRTSLGSRQDAVGLTPILCKNIAIWKNAVVFFSNFFRIFQGSPKMVGIVLFSNFFRILINLQYLAVSGSRASHNPSVQNPVVGVAVAEAQTLGFCPCRRGKTVLTLGPRPGLG